MVLVPAGSGGGGGGSDDDEHPSQKKLVMSDRDRMKRARRRGIDPVP
jgi:hypothetical protein